MTNAMPKLLTAVAAAAFLSVSPLSAQTVGSPELDRFTIAEQITPTHRENMLETFRGLTLPPAVDVAIDTAPGTMVPPAVELHPVPEEIIAVSPEVTGYHYYTLADGTIVLVDPVTREIAMTLD